MAVGDGFQSQQTPPGGLVPLKLGETLGAAWRLTAADLGTLVAVCVACALPAAIIGIAILAITLPAGATLIDGKLYVPQGTSPNAWLWVNNLRSVISAVFSLISAGAMYRILLGRHLGRPAKFTEGIGYAVERFLPLLGLTIMVTIVVGIGFVLFVIPGIYAGIALSMAVPAVMTQRIGPFRAMGWSMSLIQGHWWFVLFRVLIPALLAAAVSFVVSLVVLPGLVTNSLTMLIVLPSLISVILTPLLAIYVTAVSAVVFVDLNVRKGWTSAAQIIPNW
ncbi:MAG: hypothetical protein J2O48_03555 [Solirubrobacterales bacterium]|nr:hypothetical protein [Solirubrobacterales bacterium]